jgi:acetyl-CoA carboxylase beta subunit
MLGDIILAEPKALDWVYRSAIEQTLKQKKIPEGFQSPEYLLAPHGFLLLDAVVL